MKQGAYRKVKVAAKGDRLNWTPLKQAKPVYLATALGTGRLLTNADLAKTAHTRKRTPNYFIP